MATARHDADKENVHRTRKPVLKNPLPALPKHLLEDKEPNHKPEMPHRHPLKTINAQTRSTPTAGPSKEVSHKPKRLLNINTKHVTVRQRSKDDKGSKQNFDENKKENTLGAVSSAVTPNLNDSLEPDRVRSIKGSPKTSHNRELQGLSPPVEGRSEKPDDKYVTCRQEFNESLQDRLRTPAFWTTYMSSQHQDYTTDVFEYLLDKEIKPLELPRIPSITRARVINWLMKVNGADGNPGIIQAACWYLDSVLDVDYVQLDNLQLVAAACLWIAQKLNGSSMSATRLVTCNSAFTKDKLLRAERAVMIILRWPNQPIVAQDFITYLSWWCDELNAGEIEVAATFLAMCGLLADRVICDEYPSVIAVAAVRTALLLLRKEELMPRLQICDIFIAAQKKAANLAFTCCILRRAVLTVGAPLYEYKAPLDHYGMPPWCIAQKIIHTVNHS